jgi:hypothetical protein
MTLTASPSTPSGARAVRTRLRRPFGRYGYWSLQRSEEGRWRKGEHRLPFIFGERGRTMDGLGVHLTIGVGRWAVFVGSGKSWRFGGWLIIR